MGWFKKAFKKVKKAFKKIKEVIEEIVEAVVDAVTEIIEDIVEAVTHLVKFVWNLATLNFSRALSELFQFGRSLLELFGGLFFGGISLIIQIGAILLSGIQVIVGVEDEGRPLNKTELAYLSPIFGESIDYNKVVIVDGDIGLFNNRGAAVTIGNKIRISSSSSMSPLTDINKHGVVVHELVHIWQYQNGGPRYISQAIIAQLFSGATGEWVGYPGPVLNDVMGNISTAPVGYSFVSTLLEDGEWHGLNPEQQGTFIDAAFAFSMDFNDPDNFNFIFPVGGDDFSEKLRTAAAMVRRGEGVPIWPPITIPI